MSDKIVLTEAQKKLIEPCRQKWFKIGTSCDPIDWDSAVKWSKEAYRAAEFDPPSFFFAAGSPISGALAGVCLQRYFIGMEPVLKDPEQLDKPFLEGSRLAVEEIAAALAELKPGRSDAAALKKLIAAQPTQLSMKEYVDKHHIEPFEKEGKNLPFELPDVSADMRQQLALQLVDAVTETTNDGPLPSSPAAKRVQELPTRLAALGRTNGKRYVTLVAIVLRLILNTLSPSRQDKFTAHEELALLIHRRLRAGFHQWLLQTMERVAAESIPATVTDEVARQANQQFSDQANGNHDTSWAHFYDFLLHECKVKQVEPLRGLLGLAQACGWWTPLRWAAIFQHRPVEQHCDETGRLHKDGGPVCRFRDGFQFWMLNGVPVDREVAELPGEKLDPNLVLTTVNADARREILRKIGIERYIHKIGAKSVHKEVEFRDRDGYLIHKTGSGYEVYRNADGTPEPIAASEVAEIHYELLEFSIGQDRTTRALKMSNPSLPEVWHVECVDPSCQTVQDAINFRNSLRPDQIDEENGAWMLQQGDVLLKPRGAKTFRPRPRQLT